MGLVPGASQRRVCRVLGVSRSILRPAARQSKIRPVIDEELAAVIRLLIRKRPTYGYRMPWALLRFNYGIHVNRKKVHRILKLKRWFVHQRQKTPRPRVQGRKSVAARSNERWAMDVTQNHCRRDGWGHPVAVIDCHDREIIGYEFASAVARRSQKERSSLRV